MLKKNQNIELNPNIKSNNEIFELKQKVEDGKTLSNQNIYSKFPSDFSEILDEEYCRILLQNEDLFLKMLIDTNDEVVTKIQNGYYKESKEILEKLEKLLEQAANSGKILDRNIVIVILYNSASAYQGMWILDMCSRYIDGTIYNLRESIKADEINYSQGLKNNLSQKELYALKAIKLKKQHFLMKVYLQHCAVLSQLAKHEESLTLVKKSDKIMRNILNECREFSVEMKKKIELEGNAYNTPISANIGTYASEIKDSKKHQLATNEELKISSSHFIFRDEVPYLKIMLNYAIPILNEIIDNLTSLSLGNKEKLIAEARRAVFHWKSNENKIEKSLLGIVKNSDWLKNLNIGTIMHMKPLRYQDYALKKELISEINKEGMQEKVILNSLILFTKATEMRFLETEVFKEMNNEALKDELIEKEGYKKSEIYHLKAIELACWYINGSCPYIEHLISSYHKNYNNNLETIANDLKTSTSDTNIKSTHEETTRKVMNSISSPKKENFTSESNQDSLRMALPYGKNEDKSDNITSDIQKLKSMIGKNQSNPMYDSNIKKKTSEIKTKLELKLGLVGIQSPEMKKGINLNNVPKLERYLDTEHARKAYENSISSPRTMNQSSNKKLKVMSPSSMTKSDKHIMKTSKSPEIGSKSKSSRGDFAKRNSKRIKEKKQEESLTLNTSSSGNIDKRATKACKTDRLYDKIDKALRNKVNSSDKKKEIDSNTPANNIFFYKDFSKLIQNLHSQDNLEIKKGIHELIKNDKYAIYKKSLSPIKYLKDEKTPKKLLNNSGTKSLSPEKLVKDSFSRLEGIRMGISQTKNEANNDDKTIQKSSKIIGKYRDLSSENSKENLGKSCIKDSQKSKSIRRISKSSSVKHLNAMNTDNISKSISKYIDYMNANSPLNFKSVKGQ